MNLENNPSVEIGIIGMGASGSMAAYSAALHGANVHLFDKNEKLGKKIYITGKGRCNVTNATPMPEFMEQVVRNKKFLYSAFYTFSNNDTMQFFENLDTPLNIERGQRVFPKSNKSNDINQALEKSLQKEGVHLHKNERVISLEYIDEEHKFLLITDQKNYSFDRVIIATGGLSYPSTGSSGNGYKFAEKFGHTIIPCVPSLVAIENNDEWISKVEGLSLKNVMLKVKVKKKVLEEFGELVFTNNGISGPIALRMSAHLGKLDSKDVKMAIDWKPALDQNDLLQRFIRERDDGPNRMIRTLLESLLPKRIVPIFESKLKYGLRKPIHSWKKQEQLQLIELLKNFPLHYSKLAGFRQAIITNGGIKVTEVDSSTMESKLQKDLYFCGEILDVDAYTGGYNLQIAFSTGYLAGQCAAKEK